MSSHRAGACPFCTILNHQWVASPLMNKDARNISTISSSGTWGLFTWRKFGYTLNWYNQILTVNASLRLLKVPGLYGLIVAMSQIRDRCTWPRIGFKRLCYQWGKLNTFHFFYLPFLSDLHQLEPTLPQKCALHLAFALCRNTAVGATNRSDIATCHT